MCSCGKLQLQVEMVPAVIFMGISSIMDFNSIPFYLLDHNRYFKGILYLLLICIVLNAICSYLQINGKLYRLICVRHVFVAAIAYMWLHIEKINKWWILLLGCSSYLYLINYRFDNLEPFCILWRMEYSELSGIFLYNYYYTGIEGAA